MRKVPYYATIAAAVAAMSQSVLADTVNYDGPTYVVQCRDADTLKHILGAATDPNPDKEMTLRFNVARATEFENGYPVCDYVLDSTGVYMVLLGIEEVTFYDGAEVERVDGVRVFSTIFVLYDLTGQPMYTAIVFPIYEDGSYGPGYDTILNVIGQPDF